MTARLKLSVVWLQSLLQCELSENIELLWHDFKLKVKYVDLYSASSRSASKKRATVSHKSALISANQLDSQAFSEHCDTTDTGIGVSHDMPIYSSSLRRVLILPGQAADWVGLGAYSTFIW